jgi:hypothetical protein
MPLGRSLWSIIKKSMAYHARGIRKASIYFKGENDSARISIVYLMMKVLLKERIDTSLLYITTVE